jgi:hypothetical protein
MVRYLFPDIDLDTGTVRVNDQATAIVVHEVRVIIVDKMLLDESVNDSFAHQGIVIAVTVALCGKV